MQLCHTPSVYLIEDILEIDDKRDLNFLKYQTIDELEDIYRTIK